MPSLPPNLTARAWDFASAVPSLKRMAAACGLPTTRRAAQAFTWHFPSKSSRLNEPSGSPTVFVVDDDPLVRAAIQGMLRSVGLRSETFAAAQEFLGGKR